MNQQTLLILVVAAAASLPGLIASWLMKRQTADQFATQSDLRKQMQEQINAQQNTIRFMARRLDELEQARAREYAETEILRQELEEVRQEMEETRRGVTALMQQVEAANMTPAWTPPAKRPRNNATSGKAGKPPHDEAELRRDISGHFNLEEIRDLAFQLNIEPDNISGETKDAKARALISYVKNRGRLDELIQLVRSLRPKGEN